MTAARALAAVALLVPALGTALEPRFDHRDTHGLFAEAVVAHDTVARSGRASASAWRTAARVGWGFDVTGDGGELLLGAAVALRSFDDPEGERVLLAVDGRYRGYFGTEELKTFFDIGAWAPLRSRLAAGPLVGLGAAYDFSRFGGLYLSGSFATAFGEARVASLCVAAGGHFRFEFP